MVGPDAVGTSAISISRQAYAAYESWETAITNRLSTTGVGIAVLAAWLLPVS